jgi:hypothetical protein
MGLFESVCRPVKTTQQFLPWSLLFPCPSPQRKKSTTYTKTSLHQISHHHCVAIGIDPIGSPHPWIQCNGPLQKDPHPEPSSDRVLTSSRTHISSHVVIAREQWRTRSNNLPRRNSIVKCTRVMGQEYPFTGSSLGTNPLIYPSFFPRALGNLPGNILPKDI